MTTTLPTRGSADLNALWTAGEAGAPAASSSRPETSRARPSRPVGSEDSPPTKEKERVRIGLPWSSTSQALTPPGLVTSWMSGAAARAAAEATRPSSRISGATLRFISFIAMFTLSARRLGTQDRGDRSLRHQHRLGGGGAALGGDGADALGPFLAVGDADRKSTL